MTVHEVLHRLRTRPGMFGLDGSYDMCVAFLWGYDVATEGRWLPGFTAWLQERLGYGANLGWQSLVPRLAFPQDSTLWQPFGPRERTVDAVLRDTLLGLLAEYTEQIEHTEDREGGPSRQA